MDILNPELEWVEGRCYRKITTCSVEKKQIDSEDLYQIAPDEFVSARKKVDLPNDDIPSNIQIQHEGVKFWTSFPLPGSLIGFVIGKKHQTKTQIQEQTDTIISFPDRKPVYMKDKRRNEGPGSQEREEENIMINGHGRNNVAQAVKRVLNIIYDARWKIGEFTHFVSIPMNSRNIQEKFQDFKNDVLAQCNSNHQLTEDMFEPPSRLHLTLCMLVLFNERERESATGILQQQKKDILHILGKKKLRVEVKGLEYMNDDPSEVDVLYGKVTETDGDNSLQIIADNIDSAFAGENFARRRPVNNRVKLHVTLIKSRSGPNGVRDSFDARKLFQKYENFSFGEATISEMHISIRFTKNEEGYYRNCCVLKLD